MHESLVDAAIDEAIAIFKCIDNPQEVFALYKEMYRAKNGTNGLLTVMRPHQFMRVLKSDPEWMTVALVYFLMAWCSKDMSSSEIRNTMRGHITAFDGLWKDLKYRPVKLMGKVCYD